MFLPRPFTEPDRSAAVALAQAVGVGHLVVGGTDGFCSTPMPFLVDDEGVSVRGHLARPNPLLALLPADALLIVPGTDAYISPSWYPSKREHGRVVPTWNYEVVHLRGWPGSHSRIQLLRHRRYRHSHLASSRSSNRVGLSRLDT